MIMSEEESTLILAKKLTVNYCFLLVFGFFIFRVLEFCKESYAVNCVILFLWMAALVINSCNAGIALLNHQTTVKIDPIALFEMTSEYFGNYQCFKDLFAIRSSGLSFVQGHKIKTIGMSGIFALMLSSILITIAYQFHVREIYFEYQISNFRIYLFCWWMFTIFNGLKFGGLSVTESQHRQEFQFPDHD